MINGLEDATGISKKKGWLGQPSETPLRPPPFPPYPPFLLLGHAAVTGLSLPSALVVRIVERRCPRTLSCLGLYSSASNNLPCHALEPRNDMHIGRWHCKLQGTPGGSWAEVWSLTSRMNATGRKVGPGDGPGLCIVAWVFGWVWAEVGCLDFVVE